MVIVTVPRRCWRWVLVLGVIAALAVMHHVVGAHQHGPTTPAPVVEASHGATGSPHGAATTPADGSPSSAANLHVHGVGDHHATPDGDGGVLLLLHTCLAVLGAVAAAVALGLVALRSRPGGLPAPVTWSTAASAVPPAPPVPRRLARLQVLRL